MKESKEDRFCRVAEARVNKIIKMMHLLGTVQIMQSMRFRLSR